MIDEHRIEDLLRELAPQVLGVLARRSGDFESAEDATQEALLAAATRWPVDGLPAQPRGWLIQTATRKLTDLARSEIARRRREELIAAQAPTDVDVSDRDDTLLLLFLCSHPSLSPASAIALTLRAVGGLTTAEIARAFLVPEATMAQRISRAKQRIADVTFELPDDAQRAERLAAVLQVLYLIFNEGYTSSAGAALHRITLSDEAIRLTRTLHATLPDDPEVTGLLALMLLTDARRPARATRAGELVPLAEQDRSLWNRALIEEGCALITAAVERATVGSYQLQAAIAAVHDDARSAAETDWPQILAFYELLDRLSSNPFVTLNRAVAAAMVHGPSAGLTLLEPLDGPLAGHFRLDAVRAHLFELAGRTEEAIAGYRAAADRTTSLPEQRYLTMKAARLNAAGRTRAFFGPRAADWEDRFPDDGPLFARAVAELAPPEGGAVLDAACGTGRALPILAEAVGPAGTVIGVDLTAEMLGEAQRRGRSALVLADVMALPLRTDSVDAVFAAGLISHLSDPVGGLRELARVSRVDGRLALFHPIGRAALARRHGRELDPDDLRSEHRIREVLAMGGWRCLSVDDAADRYLVLAVRA